MENIAKNKFVAVSYKLYSIDGDKKNLEEETTADRPFFFISGFSLALPAFEEQVVKLEKGQSFDFTLTPEEAFGEFEDSHVLNLEREMFCINGHFDHDNVFVDAVIPLQNEDGNRFMGKVLEITDDHVRVDLNHPLAGKTLQFTGTVDENRDATNEEIERLINIQNGHDDECGCGCGHHHDHEHGEGCCGGHHHDHEHGEGCCGGHHHDHEHGEGCCGGHHHDHEHGEGCGCGHHHDHEHGEGCGCGHHHDEEKE